MKHLTIIVLFLACCFCSYAQTDSIYVWNKWCRSRDSMLLFNSGNNTIQIYCKEKSPKLFSVKSLDRSLRVSEPEIEGDTINVPAMPYPEYGQTMRLGIYDSRTSALLRTVEFSSADIPEPVTTIGRIDGATATKKSLLMQTKLRVVFPNSLYSYPYSIKQYSFKTKTTKGPVNVIVKGFFLPIKVLGYINNATEDATVEFFNIKATCPHCSLRALADVKIKLKKE